MTSFTSLQEIKLLRLQDEADEHLIKFVDRHLSQNTPPQTPFTWEPACARALTNLSIALLTSKIPSIRFIGPQLSAEACLHLPQTPATTLAALGSRLTSLDIIFCSNSDITSAMTASSSVLGRLLSEARSLVSIHIGFPPKDPLELDLDAVLHGITWNHLRTLSLQGWRLAAHEIIALARRHRSMLRELRLSAVYLRRGGGRWRDVLAVFREEMEFLACLSLRDIDYEERFDNMVAADGVEVFDDRVSGAGPSLPVVTDGAFSNGWLSSVHGPGRLLSPISVSRPAEYEKVQGLGSDNLGDDGVRVPQDQIPLWEAWVLSGRGGVSNGHK